MHSKLSMLQVARAGRFGTKGLSITFVADETDAKVLNSVQDRFEVNITELPDEIDVASYSELRLGCRRALLRVPVPSYSELGLGCRRALLRIPNVGYSHGLPP